MKRWTNEEHQILLKNYPKFGANFCAKLLNRTYQSIQTRCKIFKIKMNKADRCILLANSNDNRRKYSVKRELFLNIETQEVAYILGLLWADGSLKSSRNTSRITLTLKREDADQVIPIFTKTGNWRIKTVKYNCHKNPVTVIQCNDRILHNFLKELNYLNKSGGSAELVIKKIPENLRHYWWRGYFDGDGTFNFKPRIGLQFSSVTSQDWTFFNLLLLDFYFGVCKCNYITRNGINHSCSKLSISSKNGCKMFLDYIYKGNKFGLNRKYLIYKNFLKEKKFNT